MKERKLNIDLLKCIAIVFVVGVHFFLHTNYYGQSFTFKSIFLSSFIWMILMTCVPLFIMTTGYLMKDKTYSEDYFIKLLPVIGIYALTAAVYTFFDMRVVNEEYLGKLFENIFSFSHYAWYVNLYIGLYMLIPFLNAGFNSLTSRKNQVVVLGILVLFTIVPPTLSLLNNNEQNFMILPHIIPDYWKGLWPITYYLLGAFLASSKKKSSFKELVFVIFILDILSVFGLAAISETTFGIEYTVLPVFLLSSLIFYSVIHLKVSIKNEWLKRVVLFISKNTLPIYLLSVIGDYYWYPKMVEKWGDFTNLFLRFPLIVLFLLIQAILMTFILNTLLKFIKTIILK
ncbi:acyltransferase family protein [Streptococcus australis]|uniref:acyltransferase family protein n=1 Tax=Streptococcus australis TaxID=113107 RepID=UPI001CC1382C|nr:acyltransferase family protein [Streptococcus australis]MBZ2154753.1 acyltransferase family protein [Streptococcus australis]